MIRQASEADIQGIAEVSVASWKSTYRGMVPDSYLDKISIEQRAKIWEKALCDPQSTTIVLVAEDDTGRIVGFCSGGPNRDAAYKAEGELYAIYLLQEAQRNGLGTQLVQQLLRLLRGAGYGSCLVWALSQNTAVSFYEGLGAVRVGQGELEMDGVKLMETALCWQSI
ncbi:GNAT family N-acetyltransferase [Paenibacillus sp. CAA11]|nr:GNAT family N-acetyltransferase [Paenibacillus sp. CAA11]